MTANTPTTISRPDAPFAPSAPEVFAISREAGAASGSGSGEDTVVQLCGELDILTAPRLLHQLLRLPVEPGGRLVLDLSRVTFCDSTAVTLFLQLDLRKRAGTGLSLRQVAGQPAKLMRLLNLSAILPCSYADSTAH